MIKVRQSPSGPEIGEIQVVALVVAATTASHSTQPTLAVAGSQVGDLFACTIQDGPAGLGITNAKCLVAGTVTFNVANVSAVDYAGGTVSVRIGAFRTV